MTKSFKETVQAMSGKEIVMAMVNGLLHGYYTINMGTFGNTEDGICFGCAATHCVTEISGVKFDPETIYYRVDRCKVLDIDYAFLDSFENAIDSLRKGYFHDYNDWAKSINISLLPRPVESLPFLYTDSWKDNIQAYIDYANTLT